MGAYHEIAPPDRLGHTETFDDYAASGESVVTTRLVEQGGKTTLTGTVLYPSRQVRDAVIESGTEHGAAETTTGSPSTWRRAALDLPPLPRFIVVGTT